MRAARALAGRAGADPRSIPLGRINDRWFVANCGVGFDAALKNFTAVGGDDAAGTETG